MRRENVFFHDEIFVEDNLRGHEEELWFVGSFDLSKIFMEDGNLFLFKLIAKFFFFARVKVSTEFRIRVSSTMLILLVQKAISIFSSSIILLQHFVNSLQKDALR